MEGAVIERPVEERTAVGVRQERFDSEEERKVAQVADRSLFEQPDEIDLVTRPLDESGIPCVQAPDPPVGQDAEGAAREKHVVAKLRDRVTIGRATVKRELKAFRVSDRDRALHLRL